MEAKAGVFAVPNYEILILELQRSLINLEDSYFETDIFTNACWIGT